MLHPIPNPADAPKMREVVLLQRRLIRALCKLPENSDVDADWLVRVWKSIDADWVCRFWGQVNKGPRGKAIKAIAAASPTVKQELKRIAWSHLRVELRYTGHETGQLTLTDWEQSDVHKHFKELMIAFYKDWLQSKNVATPGGEVSISSLYQTGLGRQTVCPYCDGDLNDGNRRIDHFFPIAVFPVLSVSLHNLIPVCESCNSISHKGVSLPCSPEASDSFDEWFHPHFRTADRKLNVELRDKDGTLCLEVRASGAGDQRRVENLRKCVNLDWEANLSRDLQSYCRDIVTDLLETPAADADIEQALVKWSGRYDRFRGQEPHAIKKHGCFNSMASMPSIRKEIAKQLEEDQRIATPPSNTRQRKA